MATDMMLAVPESIRTAVKQFDDSGMELDDAGFRAGFYSDPKAYRDRAIEKHAAARHKLFDAIALALADARLPHAKE